MKKNILVAIMLVFITYLMASSTINGTLSFVNGPLETPNSNVRICAIVNGIEYISSASVTSTSFSAVFNNLPANNTISSIKLYSNPSRIISYDGKHSFYPEIKVINISTNTSSYNAGSFVLTLIDRMNIKVSQNVNIDAFRSIEDALACVSELRCGLADDMLQYPIPIRNYKIALEKGRYAPVTMNSPLISMYSLNLIIEGVIGSDPYNPSYSTVFKYPSTGTYSNFISDISYTGSNPPSNSVVKALITLDGFDESTVTFKNIAFTEFYAGINFTTERDNPMSSTYSNSGMNHLVVDNCRFYKLANKRFTCVPSYDTSYLKGNGCAVISQFPVEVKNSVFLKNSLYHLNDIDGSKANDNTCLGTAIYVKTSFDNMQNIVKDCTFEQNQGRGGIVYVENAVNNVNTSLVLEGNTFKNNYIRNCINLSDPSVGFNSPSVYRIAASGLALINLGTVNFTAKYNSFYSTEYADPNLTVNDPYIVSATYPNGEWLVSAPEDALESVMNKGIVFLNAVNNYLQNNTFSGYKQLCIYQMGSASSTTMNAVNNLFNPNYNPYSNSRPFPYRGAHEIIGSYNFYNAPENQNYLQQQTIMPSNLGNIYKLNYEAINNITLVPIWDNLKRSLVIDNGSVDLNNNGTLWYSDVNDQDSDGTRMDIGFQKSLSHGAFIHSLKRETNNTINWICLPYMDRIYDNGNSNTIYSLFNDYHDNGLFLYNPRYIKEVKWNYNVYNGTALYSSTNLVNEGFVVQSQYGLKVELRKIN